MSNKGTLFSAEWNDEVDIIKKHWRQMPEFKQEKEEPYAMIKVRFDSEEELQEFSKLIGQKLTNRTKSIWHPELIRGKNALKRFISE